MDHAAHLVVGDWGSGIEQVTCLQVAACMQWTAGDAQYFFSKSALRALPISIKVLDEEHVFFGRSKIIY
jgi:hypothetical protein